MAAPPPVAPLVADAVIMYKGYRIEPGSYVVGSGSWSPRVVIGVKTDDGAWRRTPLYAKSSAKFLSRDEADRSGLDVARAWIDAAVVQQSGRGV